MRALAIALVCCAGCAPQVEGAVSTVVQAIGEPNGTFPSPDERLGIMAINRARSDPATIKGPQSMLYPARPPVTLSYVLSRSARFHATNLESTGVTLMHSSPCPLNANVASANCDGTSTCACASAVPTMCAKCAAVAAVNTCGTDTFTRIGYFTAGSGTSATGEVASAGYKDPLAVVDGWMDEAAGADGHRTNLLDVGITSTTMGYGHAVGSGCYSPFDVSDSGSDKAPLPKLPTAAVSPVGGAAGTYTFYATWNDPTHGAPAKIDVVVDGACVAMTRELGTDTLNATYKTTSSLSAGCHNYWILAVDGSGARATYPTTGAITISAGGTACSGEYLTTAPAASCDGASSSDLGGGNASGDGGSSAADLATSSQGDLAGGTGVGGNGPGVGGNGPGVGGNGGVPGNQMTSSGCSIGGTGAPSGLMIVVMLALLALAHRRRRD